MQDLIVYNGSVSLDVKLQDQKFIHPFLSFNCLFLCLLIRSFVHTKCMCLKKSHLQVQWKNERVPDETALRVFIIIIIIIIAKVLLKLCGCTCTC